MKRYLTSLFLVLVSAITIHADSFKNFFYSYKDEHYTKEQILSSLADSIDFPNNTEMLFTRKVEDQLGMSHYTYQQYIDGIKVEGSYILLHELGGIIKSMNGRILEKGDVPNLEMRQSIKKSISNKVVKKGNDIEPVLFEHQGQYYSAYKYFDESKFSNIYIDSKSGELIAEISLINYASANGTAYTFYYGWKNIIYDSNNGKNTLADSTRNIFTVDASTYDGSNLASCSDYTNPNSEWYDPLLTSVTITWAAQSWWYNALTDNKPDFYIIVKRNGVELYRSGYYSDVNPPVTFNIPVVIEADGNLSIEVCDYDGVSDDSAGSVKVTKTTAGEFSWNNSKTQATYTISKAPHAALDVHWGMEKVYDFYIAKFNQVSFDGQGSPILQMVNPPSNVAPFSQAGYPNNASAFGGSGIMAYGFGDAQHNPFVTIDVMGHEFTHMVTGANGDQNLPNYGEGGALNESFGDIMGNAIEEYATGEADWLVAAGVDINSSNHALRSLNKPKSMGGPSTYQGTNWGFITGNPTSDNDMDYVHKNCGVQNYWFYLLSEGGSGNIDDNSTNEAYSVVGIGMDKAIQIVYRNLLYYITSSSLYFDSRNGSIQAAIDLYGQDSQEHQSVMNAWHAVGVGNRYVAPSEDFELKPGKYVIVANRDKNGDKNWYYMTSDLGTASTKRFQAVSTGTESMDAIDITDLEDKYVWTLEADGSNWKLKNGTQYISWSSGNSAKLDATGKSLTFDVAENQVLAHFNDGTAERYLSLNATTNNNYFAFYSGTNQIEQLFFLPYDDGTNPPIESDRYVVLAQRNATSNWFYMTSDLGTASNKRYQAVDAGTPELANVVNNNLADKYYWELEGNKLKTSVGYSTWISGNSANFDATGKELNIQQLADGTYTFSFVEGENTRYLALNKTEGNNYFAYYVGTNQIYKLTLVKEGEEITPQALENTNTKANAVKFLRDGQIFILRGGKVYSIDGHIVR